MFIKINSLIPSITNIVVNKSTEYPFTGEYTNYHEAGTYLCRLCGVALFRSKNKFNSNCGWPSFDEEIVNAVSHRHDMDGKRIEVICSNCSAHLGHVFHGESFTPNNIRYCINSLSLDFVSDATVISTEEAIFAAGCFWGIEYYFKKHPGVLKTEVGYSGGFKPDPTYQEVCGGNTGHYEAIRVVYDNKRIDFLTLARYFFEIHDPTQSNGQGPDIGEQYSSVAFYYTEEQKNTLNKLITILKNQGLDVKTKILPVSIFWPAELYHQDYYSKTNKQPYCHPYKKKFP